MSQPPSTVPGGPGARPGPGLARRTARAALVRVDAAFSQKGPAFKQLAVSWSANVAGDTLVTVALAGSLFFEVPSAQARAKVALYLLLTIAPFIVVAPVLGAVFHRFPAGYRAVLASASALRALVAVVMTFGLRTLWLFPLAFTMLVLSRLYGISKSSMLPVALPEPVALVSANALLARFGIYAGAVAALVGAGLGYLHSAAALGAAAVVFLFSAFTGLGLPDPRAAVPLSAAAPAVAPS
ncbi:MAG TPA: MFS transporter, partial [Acidimicrobiia bacterium]|nr:MFS transporter [Acidimicrobiia bacterium]